MRRTLPIIIGIIIISIIAVAAWNRGQTVATTPEQTGNRKMAFADLVRQGGTYKCSVVQSVNGATTTGSTHMDKGKLRGDFISTYAGESVNVSFIIDETHTYLWNSAMTTGFKLPNRTEANASSTAVTASPDAYIQSISDYNCTDWTADQNLFVLPKAITFEEVK